MSNENLLEKNKYYIEMKKSLQYNNSQIKSLMDDNINLSFFLYNFDLINKDVIKHENAIFLQSLQNKIDNNTHIISILDYFLKHNCEHNIIEDYIEGGVEKDMIKIKYCEHCEITF